MLQISEQFPELNVIEWSDIRVPKQLERFRAIVKPGYLPYYFRARRFLKKLFLEQQFDVVHQLSPFSWRYPSPAAGLGGASICSRLRQRFLDSWPIEPQWARRHWR